MKDNKLDKSAGHPRSGSLKQEAFNQFINDLMIRKAEYDRNSAFEDASSHALHFERHLFFVTVQFRPGLFSARDPRSTYVGNPIFQAYKAWYLDKCEEAIGPKFKKFTHNQPLSVAFLDVEGTRQSRASSIFEVPHLHALFLTESRNADTFNRLYETGQMKRYKDDRITGIDIRRYSDDGRGLGPITSYAAKFARMNLSDGRYDMDLQCYPDVAADKYDFYSNRCRI